MIHWNLARRGKRVAGLAAALLVAAVLPAAAAAQVCNPRSYGAKADGKTLDTRAIQAAIDHCAASGGGTVLLSGGTFLSAPIVLKSHITLDIAGGATLLGTTDENAYPKITEFRQPGRLSLISASHSTGIAIVGDGTIDGSGQPWWKPIQEARKLHRHLETVRPRLIVFDHCSHITMHGVTVENSPMWQIVPYYSRFVDIHNIRVLAPPDAPNTDGIDPFSSSHVTISHVYIDVGDDDVAIKSGQPGSPGPDSPSRYITVTDSTFMHGHGLSIGSEIAGGVQHVLAENIHFEDTDNGVRVKSNRDRGNNIGDFVYRNLTMKNVKTPILITEYYPRIPRHAVKKPVTRLTPHFHDIEIDNLVATGARDAGIVVGLPESPARRIVFRHVHLSARTGMIVSYADLSVQDFFIHAQHGPAITRLAGAVIHRAR